LITWLGDDAGFPLTWKSCKVRELIWSGNFVDGRGKMMCVIRIV